MGYNIVQAPVQNYGYGSVVQRQVPPQPGSVPVRQPAQPPPVKVIYTQKTTKNKSFLDMSNYLKSIGIQNHDFMLALIDPDLDGVDPYDPNLNQVYKQKILMECIRNYFYFLREVVRIPSPGGQPVRYELHRGNLALNFCMSLNLSIFLELPRQTYKTVSTIVRYLYIYNFGTTNSKIAFLHKAMDGAKDNLQTLKNLRDLLPPYLVMKEKVSPDGKVNHGKDNVTEMTNPFNLNNIKVYGSATNKAKAASLLRGKSIPLIYMDEFAFLPFSDVVYSNMIPAYKISADNAKNNGAPYGILMTTTPGFMNSDSGRVAYEFKEEATPFSETWYDKSYKELMDIIGSNTRSIFVYIKFSYQELGRSEAWFNELVTLFRSNWADIRREVLLEWSTGVENSPFRKEDLDAISGYVHSPISTTYLLNKYRFDTYTQADTRTYPPIIGVDVSGGYKQDSSTITIIDSQTTRVLGELNCNYISSYDLAACIKYIVVNWMPNAVINVERNGGYGATVISQLIKMGLKNNLYYEIKEVTVEERQDGVHAYKQKIRTKVFGTNSNKQVRSNLIDLVIERVESHKDKICSPTIYNELLGMEIKRNGKIEHSVVTHDDQVFSWALALYVWYEGTNLAERYGIKKSSIRTDQDIDEELDYYENNGTVEVLEAFAVEGQDEVQEDIKRTLDIAIAAGGTPLGQFLEQQRAAEQQQLNQLFSTPLGQKAFKDEYNVPDGADISSFIDNNTGFTIPDSVFSGFYNPTDESFLERNNGIAPGQMTVPASDAELLDDETYHYRDHFNF